MKTKFTVKVGMRFKPSDSTIEKEPWRAVYRYEVIEKRGAAFMVRFHDGIMYGQDLFYKWELENMRQI